MNSRLTTFVGTAQLTDTFVGRTSVNRHKKPRKTEKKYLNKIGLYKSLIVSQINKMISF